MTLQNFEKFCSKKAFEIAYAIFRVTKNLDHDDLSGYLEGQALGLLNGSVTADYDEALGALRAIEYFLRLGAEIGIVSQRNAQIIINEVLVLNAAIITESREKEGDDYQGSGVDAEDDLDLASIFSTKLAGDGGSRKEDDFMSYEELGEREESKEEKESLEESDERSGEENAANFAAYSAKMRQSVILDKIQEGGQCRLKDIQEFMPDLSERTLRYDLQKLVEEGLVERVGSGGPGSYYQTKS